ncbi:superoxide dismutase [Methanolobus zinderi]|uniref:Superoxide dismutase n=1 Tax=Methanolobus zinderi TaxID=536044 RepID=A0A7D5E688_9EURY|nr:superoxide dismutase [Methanolobus zinderi]KXS44390.1 MAG: superoxide dismutase, Fe-Mn family [Methanolobus sp. T82-4]QLC48799.1 superoxide dismutase [Methanolobus zinderi]
MGKKEYTLPDLPYGYADLEPYISEEQLKTHHDKHHSSYVKKANSIIETIENAIEEDKEYDVKNMSKALSFNLGGHVLHSYFWPTMGPENDVSKEPVGELAEQIKADFGSYERFKKDFSKAASTIEGSGWAVLTYCHVIEKLGIMQIEKHNDVVFPEYPILMPLDMWEHAFYIDYKNEKTRFIDAFWNIVNWDELDKRFKALK